jgi:hypothetical protein
MNGALGCEVDFDFEMDGGGLGASSFFVVQPTSGTDVCIGEHIGDYA